MCCTIIPINIACADEVDSLEVFRKLISESMPMLKDSLDLSWTKTHVIAEFCPDNTCDHFRAPANCSIREYKNFIYLYLFYASGYTYFEVTTTKSAPFLKAGRKYAKSLLLLNAKSCDQANEYNLASCVLKSLAGSNNIVVLFVRYDEGERFEEPVDLNNELSLENIKSKQTLLDN